MVREGSHELVCMWCMQLRVASIMHYPPPPPPLPLVQGVIILSGLQGGFRVGFDHTAPLAPAKRNMPSAAEHPEVLEEYIQGEVRQGRMIGPRLFSHYRLLDGL